MAKIEVSDGTIVVDRTLTEQEKGALAIVNASMEHAQLKILEHGDKTEIKVYPCRVTLITRTNPSSTEEAVVDFAGSAGNLALLLSDNDAHYWLNLWQRANDVGERTGKNVTLGVEYLSGAGTIRVRIKLCLCGNITRVREELNAAAWEIADYLRERSDLWHERNLPVGATERMRSYMQMAVDKTLRVLNPSPVDEVISNE